MMMTFRRTGPLRWPKLLLFWFLLANAFVAHTVAQDDDNENNVLLFFGRVVNDLGEPMIGAQVQFWHTDPNGNYNHPNFQVSQPLLLEEFQYFGTATTQAPNGTFEFRTYRPGIYPQRPITHIHYKVWWNGQDILTSQFYFRDEGHTQFPEPLQLDLVPMTVLSSDGDGDGEMAMTILTANKTIVIDLGLGGSETITPPQTSGPFYPAIDFFGFDSDLTNVTVMEEEEIEGTPSPAIKNAFSTVPSSLPTVLPILPTTMAPTETPTHLPSQLPSIQPSNTPTTNIPSIIPTNMPTTQTLLPTTTTDNTPTENNSAGLESSSIPLASSFYSGILLLLTTLVIMAYHDNQYL